MLGALYMITVQANVSNSVFQHNQAAHGGGMSLFFFAVNDSIHFKTAGLAWFTENVIEIV